MSNTNMRGKAFAILTLLVIATIGVRAYVDGSRSDAEAGRSETMKTQRVNSTRAPNLGSEVGATVRRTVLQALTPDPLSTESGQQIWDVPESQLDHSVLENLVTARSIGAYRIVRIDTDLLRAQIRQTAGRSAFKIQLLEANSVELITRKAEEHSSGSQAGAASWVGSIPGDEAGYGYFFFGADGSVNGMIYSSDSGRVEIEPVKGTPHHIVWRMAPDFEQSID